MKWVAAVVIVVQLVSSSSLHREPPLIETNDLRGSIRLTKTQAPQGKHAKSPVQKFVDQHTREPRLLGEFKCDLSDEVEGLRVCKRLEVKAPKSAKRDLAGEVRRASRTIGLPGLRVHTQPANSALINIDTILYTEAKPFSKSVTLLGQEILIEATPQKFTWHHGDGNTQTSTGPGQPHPARDITHTYTSPTTGIKLRVDTTYTIRYRIGDGTWFTLADTLTITGPTTGLEVHEARPYLTKPGI